MAKQEPAAPFELPSDLTTLSDDDLAGHLDNARKQATELLKTRTAENLGTATQLADTIKAMTADQDRRKEEAAKLEADFQALEAQLNPPAEAPADGSGEVLEGEVVDAAPAAPVPVAASARPQGGAQTAPRELGGVQRQAQLNPSLSQAARVAPAVQAPRQEMKITASAALPGKYGIGDEIRDIYDLGDLVQQRAKALPVTASAGGRAFNDPFGGVNVARILTTEETDFSRDGSEKAVAAYLDKLGLARQASGMEALVAAGGWCSPSELRWDFFNIACFSGQLDLPTFGMPRGGLKWPISPSLADAASFTPAVLPNNATNLTVPWIWTETNDVIAATGGAGLTIKPCIRVPCSTFDETRAECYGVCVTAGNLADYAWPESTRNFLRLLEVAYQHVRNWRNLQLIRNTTVDLGTSTCSGTGVAATATVLDSLEFDAIQYRKLLFMCSTDVIEAILPDWIMGVLRADLAKRMGVSDLFNVTDSMVAGWLNTRNIRLQLVDDYQVRGTGQFGNATAPTTWPAFVEYMMWAPGTYAQGNALSLDLGVVRDSVLNQTNDHTAAWYEQCSNIAKFGHRGIRRSVSLCPSGNTGAANGTACCL